MKKMFELSRIVTISNKDNAKTGHSGWFANDISYLKEAVEKICLS